MIVLGIDPGASGGLALLDMSFGGSTARVLAVTKLPETERDIWDWIYSSRIRKREFDNHPCDFDRFAVIEHVHSMPKQGVASSFKFGRSYGFLRGCLIASGIPFTEVTPQKWQKALSCMSKGDKNVTKARAQQLFPDVKVTHAVADALLLAYYGRFVHQPSTPGA